MDKLTRRFVLSGLFAAPPVIAYGHLMPVSTYKPGFELAYNALTDSYDVIFPPNNYAFRQIIPEHEVWPELYSKIGQIIRGDETYTNRSGNGTFTWRDVPKNFYKDCAELKLEEIKSKFPVITGIEKRKVYAEFNKIEQSLVEKRYNTLEARILAKRAKLKDYPKYDFSKGINSSEYEKYWKDRNKFQNMIGKSIDIQFGIT